MTPLLQVNDLTAFYGSIPALRAVSISVEEGSITGLFGPNGAGKSTLLLSVMGLVRSARRSSIAFAGEEIRSCACNEIARRGISLVPEGRHVFPNETVESNLALGGHLASSKAVARENLELCLTWFPMLKGLRNRKAGSLSGGEQQVTAIARALMGSPRLLLIDELSLGIAPDLASELFATIKQLSERVTILMVDQLVNEVLSVSSYAYLLRRGEVVMRGASSGLMGDPEVVETYFA